LTDDSGRAWLTDFAEAGLAPLFWNFVSLEATIRFDWVETNELLRRQELEHCLINTDFAKPDIRDLEPIVGKSARAIAVIRKLVARTVGNDVQDYHLGIFFHAARRLADFDPTLPLTSSELARLGHILLSMAMIAEKLGQDNANEQPMKPMAANQLSIVDEKALIVMIGNRKEHLTPQPFEILWYLYKHANEVCTKEELKAGPLKGEKYAEGYLHTLIGRIRKVIEDDPEHPRYLITESNVGYRLIPKPE
jgi:DNA-binding response OmpR family regulator